MSRYRFVGEHAEDLDGGQMLEPGDFVELEGEEAKLPRAAELLDSGKLIEAGEESKEAGKSAAKQGKEG